MNSWSREKYIEAWNYASSIHNGQLVPGTDFPYINHIGLVAMEAMAVVAQDENIEKPDLLILCALLHDAIEDTGTTYEEIERRFGAEVAQGVSALTKNTHLPSKAEQMKDSIERIKMRPREIWMVKLSDRITNLQPPPRHWKKDKIAKYRNEARLILEELGVANQYLAERLEAKIKNYRKYL